MSGWELVGAVLGLLMILDAAMGFFLDDGDSGE